MKQKYLEQEKLWSRLSEIANGPQIIGYENPELKAEWLALAASAGEQLASELGLHEPVVTVYEETPATCGSVDVVGNIVYELGEHGSEPLVSQLKTRITFDDPYVSAVRWINGERGENAFANIAVKVGPWNWPYFPRYARFATDYEEELWFTEYKMYGAFWPLHIVLDWSDEGKAFIGDEFGTFTIYD